MAPLFVCHCTNSHSSAATGSAEKIRAHFFTPRLACLGKATEEGHAGETGGLSLSPLLSSAAPDNLALNDFFSSFHCNKELVACQASCIVTSFWHFPFFQTDNMQICDLQLCFFSSPCFCKRLLLSPRFPLEP